MEFIQSIPTRFAHLIDETLVVWQAGGWAMYAIALIALIMFGMGTSILVRLLAKRHGRFSESEWRRWISRPAEREGTVGEILDATADQPHLEALGLAFEQVRASEVAPFARDLKVMKVCVSAAPLMGLLGTVTGMLSTFGALAAGSGGDETMSMIAKGISEALITTETGLVVALPGLFLQAQLQRRYERYRAFLAHLETVTTQVLYRRRNSGEVLAARKVAQEQISRRLRERLGPGSVPNLMPLDLGGDANPSGSTTSLGGTVPAHY